MQAKAKAIALSNTLAILAGLLLVGAPSATAQLAKNPIQRLALGLGLRCSSNRRRLAVYRAPPILDGTTTTETVRKLNNKVMSSPVVDETTVPWIVIHDRLYTTTTISGDTTWGALVKHLYHNEGETQFVIMSGRHGLIPNKVNFATGQTDKSIFDHNPPRFDDHVKEDKQRKKELSRGLNINIQVVDTARLGGADSTVDHARHLERAIRRELSQGKVVILAWCFSLCTFHEFDTEGRSFAAVTHKDAEYAAATKAACDQSVEAIVREYWSGTQP